ncbi:sodium-dependent nutrient amino acid transporter 1-like [Musca autumnalis]|uniref:sodium-dependent nutrient amino acid transporter 1-like n=1 Tax=Musca autumnalis TaxID=221902 RepID=UPI003CEF4BE8
MDGIDKNVTVVTSRDIEEVRQFIAKDEVSNPHTTERVRDKWDNNIEFLFSCIALSVGLGNVWRFPFIALENGGGAFVIPYIVVLLLIGRPIYYLEIIIGQFSSRGSVRAFDMVPVMRGVAYGQVYAASLGITYYACIMALTLKYMFSSFASQLPWAYCRVEWISFCFSASDNVTGSANETVTKLLSSAELFFSKEVLHETESLDTGLGMPNSDLVLCLLIAWSIICIIVCKGIRSSGKVSYFLALFPYVVMFVLLGRALTLPGSWNGIVFFLKPQWKELLNPKVWYNAITQMFFSLGICFGVLMMYASFNDFRKNVHRDVMIITSIDSLTSLLAGCIIFGILGNLAHETQTTDISSVVKGGAGLAFISYPEAIAKFKYLPQLFAVLFFFMLLVLGVGSNVGMVSFVMNVIKDRFPKIPYWIIAAVISAIGFLLGIVYTTPGGQYFLNLIDFFGCSFIALFLAIAELISFAWIYGTKRLCEDIEFMLGIKTGCYWRICWKFITPGLMMVVLLYSLLNYTPLTYKGEVYPMIYYAFGWLLWAVGISQVPIWFFYEIHKQSGENFKVRLQKALQPSSQWGPLNKKLLEEYVLHRKSLKLNRSN